MVPCTATARRGRTANALSRQQIKRCRRADILPAPVSAFLHLDLALGQPPWAHQDLVRYANEIRGREFRARPFVEIVIEHLDPLRRKIAVELFAGTVSLGRTLLEVKNRDLERCNRLRPDDSGVIVRSLDDG